MNLSAQETALVLAGLRCLQDSISTDGEPGVRILDILEDGGVDADALSLNVIDKLCDRINVSGDDTSEIKGALRINPEVDRKRSDDTEGGETD